MSANTTEMQERGNLIRHTLPAVLRRQLFDLQSAFDEIFNDISVEGSDGIGRKTEAPWVRLFSKAMSPSPREGFYFVIHFSADGTSVFFTIGCGSTIWQNGDLEPISADELLTRTSWARSVVEQRWGMTDPFSDQISLGAKASLPRIFEKATVIARRIKIEHLQHTDLDYLLRQSMERLSEIYLAQLDGRDKSPGERDGALIAAIARPLKRQSRAQGGGLTGAERIVVEQRAMYLATHHLIAAGFDCKDTSATESFDILAKRQDKTIMVEVKGTTSDQCNSVLMTKNEVYLHRLHKGETALFVVSKIRLKRNQGEIFADGGEVEVFLGWDIDEWITEPIAFQVSRQRPAKI